MKVSADQCNFYITRFVLQLNQKKIDSYNLWKGKLTIKFTADDRASHITHINDLIELGLATNDDASDLLM